MTALQPCWFNLKDYCSESKHRNPPAWLWYLLPGKQLAPPRGGGGVPNPSLPACCQVGVAPGSRAPSLPRPPGFSGALLRAGHWEGSWPLLAPPPVPGEETGMVPVSGVCFQDGGPAAQYRTLGGTCLKAC